MNNYIINIMSKYGYIGILFLIMLENLFPPIPSEVILTLGGFLSTLKTSSLNFLGIVLVSTIGSLLGAIILYFIGYFVNKDKIIKLCDKKIGKILCLKKDDIIKSNNNFEKGNITVFYCRFIPILRSLISIPAGINKMNFIKFIIYTFFGSLIWNTILIYLGSLVGENYLFVSKIFNKYSKVLFCALIIFIFLKKIIKKIK